MMDIAEEFLALARALNAASVPYAVCGGFAVIIHGFPRATQDIDILAREQHIAEIKMLARALGFDVESGSFIFKSGGPGETRFHRVVKFLDDEFLVLDLLEVTPLREDVFASRVQFDVEGVPISVVGRSGLRRLKLDGGRAKDLEDLRKLELEGTNELD